MGSENLFNKETFANLLDRAKGDRSINQYANETDVSAAHISRFLRQMIESPPTPETISKFSKYAANSVTYRDLMIAAGHIDEESANDIDSPRNRRILMEELEQKFFQVILAYLYRIDFYWSIQKPEGRMSFPDMIIDIDHDGYKKWYLEFKGSFSDRPAFFMNLIHLYGRISMKELLPTDKFTIVVNEIKAYEQLLNRPPKSLRANLYVMLIDLVNGKILAEDKLCEY